MRRGPAVGMPIGGRSFALTYATPGADGLGAGQVRSGGNGRLLGILGLSGVSILSTDHPLRGLISAILGLMLSTIGLDLARGAGAT